MDRITPEVLMLMHDSDGVIEMALVSLYEASSDKEKVYMDNKSLFDTYINIIENEQE